MGRSLLVSYAIAFAQMRRAVCRQQLSYFSVTFAVLCAIRREFGGVSVVSDEDCSGQ